MIHAKAPPRHGPKEGLWLLVVIAVLFALTFLGVIFFVPR